jgi:hypothetical protein
MDLQHRGAGAAGLERDRCVRTAQHVEHAVLENLTAQRTVDVDGVGERQQIFDRSSRHRSIANAVWPTPSGFDFIKP